MRLPDVVVPTGGKEAPVRGKECRRKGHRFNIDLLVPINGALF